VNKAYTQYRLSLSTKCSLSIQYNTFEVYFKILKHIQIMQSWLYKLLESVRTPNYIIYNVSWEWAFTELITSYALLNASGF